jgi:hypothetical protein
MRVSEECRQNSTLCSSGVALYYGEILSINLAVRLDRKAPGPGYPSGSILRVLRDLWSNSYFLYWARSCRVRFSGVRVLLRFSYSVASRLPAPVLHHLLGDVSVPSAFARMRGLGFSLSDLRWGRLVSPSRPCWLLKAGWLLYTGFSPGIARVVRVELPWELGLPRAYRTLALILRMAPLPTAGAVRVPAVQALKEIPFVRF